MTSIAQECVGGEGGFTIRAGSTSCSEALNHVTFIQWGSDKQCAVERGNGFGGLGDGSGVGAES